VPPVFHRDIKPTNIVRRAGGAPVLVDFGAVCHGWRPAQGGSTVTGTFGYMPPEQLLGQVSAASDLYALGATLLHLATGREPTEFSFDAGRLSLPAEIAVRPALRRLIDALLAPAPRDRPASAVAARRMLLAAPDPTETRALAKLDRSTRPLMARPPGGRPDMVDVGPPPRDPDGPLWDVYRNLIHVFHGRRRPGSRGGFWRRLGRGSAAVGIGVVSLGIWPIVAGIVHAQRRRAFGQLFRTGVATVGQLVGLMPPPRGGTVATVTYEYEVDGRRYRGKMETVPYAIEHWQIDDPVTVVHDAADPTRSCVLYRWQ
jgi:Protein kinase domain